jgi:predicted TIM-barrel fold metal-dependent hydrolase
LPESSDIGMRLEDFRPRSKLVTRATRVERPRFPVIDAHNHLADPFGGGWDRKPLNELLEVLDAADVTHFVDLDGGWGEEILRRHLDYFKAKAPERFRIYGGVDWSQWHLRGKGFADWAAGRLIAQKQAGAEGLKIWKGFGLQVRDEQDRVVRVNDPRLDPIWRTAGELGFPVLIHVADPVAFFDPVDGHNERWEELGAHPDWTFTSPPFPPFMQILEGLRVLVRRHPGTLFIGAHVGCYAENLEWVGEMLNECPNFYVDIAARIGELGRQPYSARRFMIQYQDRILFGSDMGPELEAYRLAFRFLETEDEYFNYSAGDVPTQGRWHVHGLHLPDETLKKIYSENARRVLG